MRKLFLLVTLILSLSCKSADTFQPSQLTSLEPKTSGEIVKHNYYTLFYSEVNEQSAWVFYILAPDEIYGTQSRTDDFRADPAVSTGSAILSDYKGSGYDQGHLCPAGDMKLNNTSML